MEESREEFIRHREICFCELHPDPHQARSAALALADVPGIHSVNFVSPTFLRVSYDVLQVTLEQIEAALSEMGFHLDNRLLYRLRRALHYYTDDTIRANNGCPNGDANCTQKIFAERYRHTDHGCRDHRPDHWRRYL
ncbi:MAG: hypothetical protein PVF91_03475 [Chromatiales bacterium]|jgi:hypothetical protein